MTKVLIIVGEGKPANREMRECDIAAQLNVECSEGVIVKDRYGYGVGTPVKVVTA